MLVVYLFSSLCSLLVASFDKLFIVAGTQPKRIFTHVIKRYKERYTYRKHTMSKYCQKFMGKTQNIFNIYSKCIKIIIIESNKTSTGPKKISQRQYRNNTLGNNSTNERKNSHGHYDHINSAKENRKQLHYQIHRASRS